MNADEVFAEAEKLREADAYKAAIELYSSLVENGHDSPDVQFGLGQCYGKAYDFDRALAHLRACFSAEPDRVAGANYYAYILERHELWDEAGHWYDVALANPTGTAEDLWTESHRCWYLEKAGLLDEARAAYAAFLSSHPTYTWGIKRYGLLLWRLGAHEHAAGVMRAAVDRMPDSPFPKLNLLEFQLLTGDSAGYVETLAALGDRAGLSLPVQVTVDLFEWWREPSADALARLEADAARLPESVHRDFDDLTEALAARGGDVGEWRRLLQLLLK
jgi:tetratricopeptide (TPR) repeat protein